MKKNFRDTVASEMIRKLEEGTTPWQKPWDANISNNAPYNPTTDNQYKGINSFWLEMAGHSDPRWMTYNQATSLDAQVIKGSKAHNVEYWQWSTEQPLLDENGKPIRDETGLVQKQAVQLERPKVFYAAVFNGSQIEGLEPYKAPALKFDPVIEADLILENTNIPIIHDQSDRAFYNRTEDVIHLPDRSAFKGAYEYYATALHEVGHATGSPERMIRNKGPFGSELYAKEELMVEMASYMMSRELGLGHNPDRHAAYVGSWINAIKEDKNYLFQAAQSSEKIRTWVMEPEKRLELEKATQLAYANSRTPNEPEIKTVIQGMAPIEAMELSEEENRERLLKVIEQEEALIQSFRPTLSGHERASLRVHTPELIFETNSPDNRLASFRIGDELELTTETSSKEINDDLMSAILASGKGMTHAKTPNLGTLEVQELIELAPQDNDLGMTTKRLIGRVQENGQSKLVQIDFTAKDPEILERYSSEFRDELVEQATLTKENKEQEVLKSLNMQPLFVSSNRKMLDRVSNFYLPEAVKTQTPTYIQTSSRTKSTQDKINQFILSSGQILDGTIGDEKLKTLPKIGIGQPEFSFDEETGFHKISFNGLVYSDKESLLSSDKHGRPEIAFSSRDEKKVQEFAQTFMNATRALKDHQIRMDTGSDLQYLVIPFEEIVQAKVNGAAFDYQARAWYAPEGSDRNNLSKWMESPQNLSNAMKTALNEVSKDKKMENFPETRVYLDVPFKEKQAVKELGAKWDREEKLWYVPQNSDVKTFDKWVEKQEPVKNVSEEKSLSVENSKSAAKEKKAATEPLKRNYLTVPYTERHEAKALGAKWDKKEKLWFTTDPEKLDALKKWSPKTVSVKTTELNPQEEFALYLKDNGVELKGLPIMDGKNHRASLEGEPNKQNASYRGFLDGRPNGTIKNFKTDETLRWVAVGQAMSEQERNALKAKATETKNMHVKEREEVQDKAAKRSFAIWKNTKGWASEENSEYLKEKNARGYGVKVNKKGQVIIPLRDIDGRIHSLQTVGKENKLFTENGRKTGLMHTIDPKKDIEYTDRIVIAEGYSTAASIHEMSGKPTIVAFDAGNLKAVALEVKKKYPKAELIFAADDDHKLEKKPPYKNVGLEKAKEAAKEVDGKVVTPQFTPEEKEKGLTDWNDFDKSRGREKARSHLVNQVVGNPTPEPKKKKKQDMDMAI